MDEFVPRQSPDYPLGALAYNPLVPYYSTVRGSFTSRYYFFVHRAFLNCCVRGPAYSYYGMLGFVRLILLSRPQG